MLEKQEKSDLREAMLLLQAQSQPPFQPDVRELQQAESALLLSRLQSVFHLLPSQVPQASRLELPLPA